MLIKSPHNECKCTPTIHAKLYLHFFQQPGHCRTQKVMKCPALETPANIRGLGKIPHIDKLVKRVKFRWMTRQGSITNLLSKEVFSFNLLCGNRVKLALYIKIVCLIFPPAL